MGLTEIMLFTSVLLLIVGNTSYFFQLKDDRKKRSFFETIFYNEVCNTQKKVKGFYFSSKIFNSLFHVLILLYLIPVSFDFNWFETNDQIILIMQIAVILIYGVSALVFPQILIYKVYEKISKIGNFS